MLSPYVIQRNPLIITSPTHPLMVCDDGGRLHIKVALFLQLVPTSHAVSTQGSGSFDLKNPYYRQLNPQPAAPAWDQQQWQAEDVHQYWGQA